MKRKTSLTLISQAKERFEELLNAALQQERSGKTNTPEMQLLKSISQKSEFLKGHHAAGKHIPNRFIPAGLGVSNLFKVNLCGYNRMIYTLHTKEEEIGIFVLFIISHPEYDKIFGYKKK